ncbi:MAG: alginate lyase family protein [Pseudomonadota bacterium]
MRIQIVMVFAWFFASAAVAGPNLILTEEGVEEIKATSEFPALFSKAMETAKARVERSMGEGIIVPVPTDPGGGYTHERHKENYKIISDAATLYQLTGDVEYLAHAEAMLLSYAAMYQDLPLHPQQKNQAPGRLFWQGLNESVWLVHVAQGYDAIREDLGTESRNKIEQELLRPVADFLSAGSRRTFQRIHNHGTWAAAAVGMTGYALGDKALVERALYGLDGDGEAGFLKQMSELFSPDGYYTEGPYYQRYALMPFVLFGQAIENNEPERKIFDYRDGILRKAITATIQQSYAGTFFPINDAIKEKGLDTQELVYGVAAAYALSGDPGLLSIAEYQGATVLTGDGLKVAKDLAAGKATAFQYTTQLLRDGPSGDQGGLGVMRMGDGPMAQTLVAKHTGQGMGHGHFDKLSIILYDAGREILTDYGAARFLNVPSKEGGRYLPENTSWAKQSIAHNTIVLGEESHFGSDWRRGQESWPIVDVFEQVDGANVVSAVITDAYPGSMLRRTTVQIDMGAEHPPVVVDVFDAEAQSRTMIDLPFYFEGQLTDSSLALAREGATLAPLGDDNGYQHLWVESTAASKDGAASFTWLTGNRFYTYHSIASAPATYSVVRTGANDPDFNLRSEQGILLRLKHRKNARFVSVFEPHGVYDPAQEFTFESDSRIEQISTHQNDGAGVVILDFKSGERVVVAFADKPDDGTAKKIAINAETYEWSGFAKVFRE